MSKKSWRKLLPTIKKVENATCIEDLLIEQGRTLVKKGTRLYTTCPFHPENTPSFSVAPESQLFYCHGCKKGGKGVIKFVEIRDETSFYGALESLCTKLKIQLGPKRPRFCRQTVLYPTSESDKSPGEAGSGERVGFATFVDHPTEFESLSVKDQQDIHEPQDGSRTYVLEFSGIGTISLTRHSAEKLLEELEITLKNFQVTSAPW